MRDSSRQSTPSTVSPARNRSPTSWNCRLSPAATASRSTAAPAVEGAVTGGRFRVEVPGAARRLGTGTCVLFAVLGAAGSSR
ncbi:MAG TPA: hypothetical protein VGE74_04860 [Gemmata sp.]